jgi:ubiquinone/menaquinone biosynthesis C-methylase UbiE
MVGEPASAANLQGVQPRETPEQLLLIREKTMSAKRDFDAAAANWDSNPHRVALARQIAEAIAREVPLEPHMKLMDYGCGTGLVTLALQPCVGEVVAADSSAGMLEALRKKLDTAKIDRVRTLQIDLEPQDMPEDDFDVIVSSMTLHHIQQAELVVRKLAESLVEGGWLAIADLDGDSEAFHHDNTGVMHFGFDVDRRQELFQQAWLKEIRTVEVTRMKRDTGEFSILLTVGRR